MDNNHNMISKFAKFVLGENYERKKINVKGKVVLMKKNVLDFNDFGASALDRAHELFGKHISVQFISATHADHGSSSGLHLQIWSFFYIYNTYLQKHLL